VRHGTESCARSTLGIGVLCALLWSAPARADGALVIRTLEHGDWAGAVEAVQRDPAWQGRAVRVVVHDADGRRSRCGDYRLELDAAGERAFERGRCDPASGATTLRLVDRAALFEADEGFARPRTVRVRAIETREGAAEGRARSPVVTELRCHLAIRPYVVDLLHGRRVRATPERFELRPVDDGVSVVAAGEQWRVRSSFVRVRYELLDRSSGRVVLRETVRLECNRGADDPLSRADGWQATIEGRPVVWLQSGRTYRGRAGLGTSPDDRGSCGGEGGAESWYAVRFEAPHRLALALHAAADAALYVRAGSLGGPEVLCRDTAGPREAVDTVLPPGTYFVAVDGLEGLARYRLAARFERRGRSSSISSVPSSEQRGRSSSISSVSFEAPSPRAVERLEDRAHHRRAAPTETTVARAHRPPLRSPADDPPALEIDRVLFAGPSRARASCGGDGAPEHVFRLHVGRPSRVSVRLESRFDAALFLRAADGREIDCARGLGAGLRRAAIDGELPVGSYEVVVDGAHGAARGPYHLTLHQRPR
jgi:hypothetical protein